VFFVVHAGDFAGPPTATGADAAGAAEDAVDVEQAEGDGEFEGVAFFAEVGGGEVDGEFAGGEPVAAVVEGGADAVDGFFDGGVGQADDGWALGCVEDDFFGVVYFDFAG